MDSITIFCAYLNMEDLLNKPITCFWGIFSG